MLCRSGSWLAGRMSTGCLLYLYFCICICICIHINICILFTCCAGAAVDLPAGSLLLMRRPLVWPLRALLHFTYTTTLLSKTVSYPAILIALSCICAQKLSIFLFVWLSFWYRYLYWPLIESGASFHPKMLCGCCQPTEVACGSFQSTAKNF